MARAKTGLCKCKDTLLWCFWFVAVVRCVVVYGPYEGPTTTALAFAHPTMVQPPQKGATY